MKAKASLIAVLITTLMGCCNLTSCNSELPDDKENNTENENEDESEGKDENEDENGNNQDVFYPTEGIAYEWHTVTVPVMPEEGMTWKLNAQSDDFNYTYSSAVPGEGIFKEKWSDYYHANWSGPSPTHWQRDHFSVFDGKLRIYASRPDNAPLKDVAINGETRKKPATYTACITSKTRVVYPVYVEAYAKIAKSVLASDVWMLSADDTQEIDIIEAYGGDRTTGDNGKTFYGPDRIHLSHHVFIREPFQDYQPQDAGSWYRDKIGTLWRDEFHRVGVYWKNPTHLEYYVDGEKVREVSGMDIIDPNGFTSGTGLTKEMDIIINMEDQSWRAFYGLTPTSEELENKENNTFLVDWIRIYNMVPEEISNN